MNDYLDSIANYLQKHPNAQMIIVGTNGKLINSGKDGKENKVTEFVSYLINNGISPDRIIARSKTHRKTTSTTFPDKKKNIN